MLTSFETFSFNFLPGEDKRNEDDFTFRTAQAFAAIDEFFNFEEIHWEPEG